MRSPELPSFFKRDKTKKINIEKLLSKMHGLPFEDTEVLSSFIELIKNMGNKLSTYDTILSDDASGRLVSLVLRKVINEARKRKDANSTEVNTYFLAAGRHGLKSIYEAIKKFLKDKKPTIKKALVVTEHIATGQSIAQLVEILESQKIDFDIASLSIMSTHYPFDTKHTLYKGTVGDSGLRFYNKTRVTGVEKGISENSAHPTKRLDINHVSLGEARDDVDLLAEKLKKLL